MLSELQLRIADRLAALEDAGPGPPAPLPAPAPQQVGLFPTVEGGRWALQALPPGTRAPPPGSVWAYLPASAPGQTGGGPACSAAATNEQLALLAELLYNLLRIRGRSSVMQGCGALPACQRLVSFEAGTSAVPSFSTCYCASARMRVLQQCAELGKPMMPYCDAMQCSNHMERRHLCTCQGMSMLL